MQKRRLFVLVIGLILSLNSYAQSDSETKSSSEGSFFFSVGFSDSIFSNGPIVPFHNFEIKMLRAGMIGGYYELPMGPGNTFFGLELGYSSGKYFGGSGGVDFIPISVEGAYVFPLANILYIGPRLKLGGIGLLGPDWNRVVLTAGARLEAELRFPSFPIGIYVAGGIDAFPTSPEFATLPAVEVGLRYPRGKLRKSGSSSSKNKVPTEPATTGSRDDSSGQAAALVPGASGPAAPGVATDSTTGAPTTTAPAGSTPATTAPGTSTPATPGTAATPATPATPGTAGTPAAPATPAAATPVTPPPATPSTTPVAPGTPTTPGPAAPSPVIAPPAIPAPASPAPIITGTGPGQNRSITLEDGRQGILNSIYFEPDTAVLIETYRPILESVGKQLAADPTLKLLIRAYAADFGTADGRYIVSVNRARFSRDYFTAQYGVSLNRFNIEAFGADKSPIYATSDWQSHRCVELILLRD